MKNKKRLIYIASFIEFSYPLEWMADGIDKEQFEVDFILLNPQVPEIYQRLKEKNINSVFFQYRGKRDLLRVFIQLFFYFLRNKPDIIHAHLFDASLVSLPAAWLSRVKKRVHTRHHGSIHHESHPGAVKYDRFNNYLSTDIVAVSEKVKTILIEMDKADAGKVVVVHHGFDFSMTVVNEEEITAMKNKYGLGKSKPVIGVISRFVEWKGVQYIIPAFKKILLEFPEAKLVLANANGNYKPEILKLLSVLPSGNYVLIEFEKNIYPLFKSFDYFIHVPVNPESEAFGQIYIEALACKIPMICTLSGIANEFIRDNENAVIVDYANSEAIYHKMKLLIQDDTIKKHIIETGYNYVINNFSIKKMVKELGNIYCGK